ncbi:hypothetical protein PMIN03_002418 [Paraphaeosphaeria minitans]|uniref:Uncharacterized protein n=1 Tax=Paraphaeosphaeria minitans TaxID=565426 RepID=A0A9P6GG47_9PLEO|nr:hypothetical protein PMIN01_07707 [Paraphaeosphaeria minitans]
MARLSLLLIAALHLGTALAACNTSPQKWIAHDKVKGHQGSPKVPGGVAGQLIKKYQPYLFVETGCVPFPAVNSNGELNSGLEASGAMNGKCSKSPGQVYARATTHKNRYAIMYAWYFPKDQNVDGPANLGHRHDWENVVVWLSGKTSGARVTGVSYSAHGKYRRYKGGSTPKVRYSNIGDGSTHSLWKTDRKGGRQPLVDRGQLSGKARGALEKADFGRANAPFIDCRFKSELDKAWSSDF